MDDERIVCGWVSALVKCPFWHGNTKRAVVCDGFRSGETVRWCFLTEGKMKDIVERLCCDQYEQCKIYKMLFEHYDKK